MLNVDNIDNGANIITMCNDEKPYLLKSVTTVVRKYNPKYGDQRDCECGHPYERHFDSYESMAPVGCKYCQCRDFKENLMNNIVYAPPQIIFDIDGTLANCEHRIKFVQTVGKKNWPAFNKRMDKDTPHHDIIWMLKTFHTAGATCLIASGRGEESRAVTVDWLDNVAGIKGLYPKLYMRPLKDNRQDNIIKTEIYSQMLKDGFNPTIAIDDRNQVVKAWRDLGLRCLQVCDGDF